MKHDVKVCFQMMQFLKIPQIHLIPPYAEDYKK
jgi:hypothetical protein